MVNNGFIESIFTLTLKDTKVIRFIRKLRHYFMSLERVKYKKYNEVIYIDNRQMVITGTH